VGTGFLGRLFGRPRRLPPDVHESLAELNRLAEQRPALAESAQFLRDALPGLYAEPIEPATLSITHEQALAKLNGGLPLLRGEALPLDVPAFSRRWLHVCASLERHQDAAVPAATAEALRRGALDPQRLTMDILNGHPEAIHAQADELGLDAGLMATVLRLTLFPVLSRVNSALANLSPFPSPTGGGARGGIGHRWDRGYCPTCGSWPLLGEFRGLEQTRFLRCGLCASEWEFPRLRCPFCDTADHRRLGYFHAENEEGKYRAATCDVCRGYIKMISSLTPITAPGLFVADLATMHLDLVAAERGYWQSPASGVRDQESGVSGQS
jgi:FdhE protein